MNLPQEGGPLVTDIGQGSDLLKQAGLAIAGSNAG